MKLANEKPVRVLYLDLDGTVRWGKDELGRFVNGAEDVRVFDEVPAMLKRYKALGWRIAGVSNQGGIALGIMTMDQCAKAMFETHRQCGEAFDKISWCQHHPGAKDPEMAVCWCRKPRAGLLIEAAHSLRGQHPLEYYPPHLALMVGDREEDAAAAHAANVAFMRAVDWRNGVHVRTVEEMSS
jgi:D-glycero-D-manno-heptose 1,7-bisphosphate phosphatase